eukprot:TRINITY_DN30187_c0_g1_i2.p1 TRINITY_DN30187_c0_g1~~TRINITY_DN30187_c0_g1_i2.p1  ORF type:complete len:123 (+),score=30.62 TRINITY_DN30187_c0_g1_i2:17-385(+)
MIYLHYLFFFKAPATTEIYTRSIVGSVRCVQETARHIKAYHIKDNILTNSNHIPTRNSKERIRTCFEERIDKTFSQANRSSGPLFSIAEELSLIHISEPTRPLYISYAVFCLKKKKNTSTTK